MAALRSYMAQVPSGKSWSPVHDSLHYALIRGADGVRRWHLVHPDAVPHLAGHDHTLHDRLGGELTQAHVGQLQVTGKFGANRASAYRAEHPEFGPVVVKESEAEYWKDKKAHPQGLGKDFFREVEEGKHGPFSVMKYRMGGVNKMGDEEHHAPNAEYVSRHAHLAGAPVVPLARFQAGELAAQLKKADTPSKGQLAGQVLKRGLVPTLLDKKNRTHISGAGHEITVQPFVHDPKEAAEQLGRHFVERDRLPLVGGQDDYIQRLHGRLEAVEHIAGAPDRHDGNYLELPMLLPDGRVTSVRHGIDYEYTAIGNGGLLNGRTQGFLTAMSKATVGGDTPHALGHHDVLAGLHHWDAPPQHGDAPLREVREAWAGKTPEHGSVLGLVAAEAREAHGRVAGSGQVRRYPEVKRYASAWEAVRSYMADVTGRQQWSPIHDPLHYALIRGHDGERRWHLVHPDAVQELPHLGMDYTLHDQLGGEVRDGGDLLHVERTFHANRVPSLIAEHPDLGPVIIKGGEHHVDSLRSVPDTAASEPDSRSFLPPQRVSAPPRSLRWSEKPDPFLTVNANEKLHLHTDLQPYEQVLREKMNMNPLTETEFGGEVRAYPIRTQQKQRAVPATTVTPISDQLAHIDEHDQRSGFGSNGEWFTQAAMVSGAPVVPVYQGRIGALKDDANSTVSMSHPNWYKHEDQYASFQPYIHDPQEAAAAVGAKLLVGDLGFSPQEDAWVGRLHGRLSTAEEIAAAPDIHEGNYVDVPLLLPGKRIASVRHGIDYEWRPGRSDGFLYGSTNALHLEAMTAARGTDSPHNYGAADVIGTVAEWPEHALGETGTSLERATFAWNGDGSGDEDLDTVMEEARQKHAEIGARDLSKATVTRGRSYAAPGTVERSVVREDGVRQTYHIKPGEPRAIARVREQNAAHPLHDVLHASDPHYTAHWLVGLPKGGTLPGVVRLPDDALLRFAAEAGQGWDSDLEAHRAKHASEGDFGQVARSLADMNARFYAQVDKVAKERGDDRVREVVSRLRLGRDYGDLPHLLAGHAGALHYLARHSGDAGARELAQTLTGKGGLQVGLGNTDSTPRLLKLHVHAPQGHLEALGIGGALRQQGLQVGLSVGEVGHHAFEPGDRRGHALSLHPVRASTAYSPRPGFSVPEQLGRRKGQYALVRPHPNG